MNLFFPILCVAAAGLAGYALEPSMRASLTGAGPAKSDVVAKVDEEKTDTPEVGPTPVSEPEPVELPVMEEEKPEPEPIPEPEPAPEPPPVAQADPEPMEEKPAPEPEPKPEPVPAPSASLSAEEIVKVMQDSIKAQQVKEFNFDQVLGWKAGEEEEVDGETYQTGVAAYKAETIFGVKTIQAKALIKDGQIAKWIWPNSGMEIK